MTERIELTQPQLDRLREYCEMWKSKGLNTGETDVPKAMDAIAKAYKAQGYEPPKLHFVTDGPRDAVFMAQAVLNIMKKHGEDHTQKFYDKRLPGELRKLQAKGSVPRERVYEMVFGCHESWLAFYHFFWLEMGKTECAVLEGLIELADHCGWWLPYTKFCILQHRPILKLDDQNRLHNNAGPSIAWRDEFKVYHYRGVRVPENIIERPHEIKPEDPLRERNAEVRRAMIELMGYDRFLPHMRDTGQARMINEDWTGKLWHIDVPDKPNPLALSEVINGSPEPDGTYKTYYIPVPPDAPDCHSAIASTYGLTKKQYRNVIRT